MADSQKYYFINIKPNKLSLTELQETQSQDKFNYYDKNKFIELIEPYCELIKCSKEDILENMCNILTNANANANTQLDTISSYCTDNKIYQLCHNINLNLDNPNYLATKLKFGNKLLSDNVVLLVTEININNTSSELLEINYDDIYDLFIHINLHYGISVYVTDKIEQFIFDNKHQEEQLLCEVELYKFKFSVFSKNSSTSVKCNKIATRLCNKQIYGDVNIISHYSVIYYDDLTLESFNKLINIITDDNMLSKKELEDEYDNENKFIVKSKYRLLESRSKLVQNCICMKENDLKKCTRCYRIKYCSKECQINDWNRHKEFCLNFKK